jgi:hypothetical protein
MFIMFHLAECCPKCEPVNKPTTVVEVKKPLGIVLTMETGIDLANRRMIQPGWKSYKYECEHDGHWIGPYVTTGHPNDAHEFMQPDNTAPYSFPIVVEIQY